GATVVPLASTMVVAPSVLTSLRRPMAVILPFSATMVSPSRIGFSSAPDRIRPILRMTSLLGPVACGASCAMGRFPSEIARKFEPGLTFGSSWIIHLYTNDRIRMNWPVNGRRGEARDEQFQPGERAERPSLDRQPLFLHHHPRS